MADVTEVFEELRGVFAQVATLRQAFDQSFADPATLVQESGDLVLLVRIGTRPYGVRLSEIAGIHRCPKIVALPGSKPVCLGIVGLRGRLHAVFHLGVLLGVQGGAPMPRWLVITPGQNAPIFAVDTIEACLPIKPEDMRAIEGTPNQNAHTRALFLHDGTTRELLHFPALVTSVTSTIGTSTRHG